MFYQKSMTEWLWNALTTDFCNNFFCLKSIPTNSIIYLDSDVVSNFVIFCFQNSYFIWQIFSCSTVSLFTCLQFLLFLLFWLSFQTLFSTICLQNDSSLKGSFTLDTFCCWICNLTPVWPDKNRQTSVKVAQKWFH